MRFNRGLAMVLLLCYPAMSQEISGAPRRLTVAQQRALLFAARPYKGQKITIAYIKGDVESETLAGDLVQVLRKAEWTGLDGFGVTESAFDEDSAGILVEGNGDTGVTAAAQVLLEALRASGMLSNGRNNNRLPASTISVMVGRRPPAPALRSIATPIPHFPALEGDPSVCPRPAPGDQVTQPVDLRSSNGSLHVDLSLHSGVDIRGMKVFCFLTEAGVQSPTLRVRPGDELVLTLKNQLSPSFGLSHVHAADPGPFCAGGQMDPSSTNLHFHGWSIPPTCHQDETLRTAIQPSDPPFEYRIRIPTDQPPGLYWYHPHPHGFTEGQVLGGASGALIVEGIEQARPDVAGLPERVLVLRDQRVPGLEEAEEDSGPGKDLSLNFVPVEYPLFHPTELIVPPNSREFWRVLNASADTYFDLQIADEPLRLIALDGVAVGATNRTHILLSPGARAEFIVTMPGLGKTAQVVTLAYDTGPDGTVTPTRVLATIRPRQDALAMERLASRPTSPGTRLAGLSGVTPAQRRKLYFSEDLSNPREPKYFVTLDGAMPKVFQMDFARPDITVRRGTVEDWVIENRSREAHAFHIHQLHFQLLERDGKKVNEQALRDTVDVPYWDGKSRQYPSIKLRMDFRSSLIVGTFVFHCHILEHEDGGMMGSIQVE